MESLHRRALRRNRRRRHSTWPRTLVQRYPIGTRLNLNFLYIIGHSRLVIKAQVLAGGRGKGKFDSGFQGGVHTVDTSVVLALSLFIKLKVYAAPREPGNMQPR
jgi:Succinyl-CoA synthetase, beta subunit